MFVLKKDTLSGDALKAVLAQEDAFNQGKNSVADIYKVGKVSCLCFLLLQF